MVRVLRSCLLLGVFFASADALQAADTPDGQAQEILKATGVRGGLVVHIGCGDGRLTAALRVDDGYLVHGLDTDAEKVELARESIGEYGPVSVDRFDGKRLPYVDNLVNLIVAEDLGDSSGNTVAMDEIMRVLAPDGVAYVKTDGAWNKTVKPRPAEIDEWTHYLHNATNNAVASDTVVGPPRQIQWVGDPKWARSHDHLASISAVVSSGGRIFYIVDEGPVAAVVLNPKWMLVARDAFNGVVLWKRSIPRWQWHLRGFRSGPAELAKRLVAVGQRVYVTLGIDAPVSALDAATGRTVTTYDGTEHALEMVCDDGTLFVVAGDTAVGNTAPKAKRRGQRPGFAEVRSQRPAYPEPAPTKRVMAIHADTGEMLWKKADTDTAELMPTTLAVSGRRVFFQNADEILCLDRKSGGELWRVKRPVSRSRPTWSGPTLVVYNDVVLSGDRAVPRKQPVEGEDPRKVQWSVFSAGGQAPVGELIAFSANDGRRLWSSKCRECYNSPVDVLVAGGLVWTGDVVRASGAGVTEGRDPMTGEVERTRPKDTTQFAPGMGHGRCYRNKATSKYLVFGRSGVEFIEVATGKVVPNHWTRGVCQYGVMPCNGLLYVPSHACACFVDSKLNGFNCLAPKRSSDPIAESDEDRLEHGPAYTQIRNLESEIQDPDDWPTYRHDGARSGCAGSAVAAKLQSAWQTELGGKLSSPVIAGGRLFVAEVDAHTVHALSAEDGQPIWSRTVGGRVDSPPTIDSGRVLFGSADGWVYCLRTSDAALAWRFRAAPQDRRIVAYGQLESAWPVHGSPLVRDGVVYCVAGRSSYLDGGIRLLRLDMQTGKKLSETLIDYRDPATGFQRKGVVRGTDMPGALPDILSCDGESVFLRHVRFDLDGQPQPQDVPHLFSPAGFLDDTWWHRTYWLIGTAMGNNYGGWPQVGNRVPAGRLLAVDDSSVYGFGRNQYIHHGAHIGIDGATVFHFNPSRDAQRRFTNYRAFAIDRGKPGTKPGGRRQPKQYRWTGKLPIQARAMVLAGKTLWLAGGPDILTSDDPAAALQGRQGGRLMAVAATDGSTLAEYPLQGPPVFDGMAAAAGRLYLATTGGKVLCFRGDY